MLDLELYSREMREVVYDDTPRMLCRSNTAPVHPVFMGFDVQSDNCFPHVRRISSDPAYNQGSSGSTRSYLSRPTDSSQRCGPLSQALASYDYGAKSPKKSKADQTRWAPSRRPRLDFLQSGHADCRSSGDSGHTDTLSMCSDELEETCVSSPSNPIAIPNIPRKRHY